MKSEKNKWANLTDTEPFNYIGRFAPSPTGPLHLGSLYTALAGFLDARSISGQWLLRIDDLDTPRNIKGAAGNILKTLDILGLHWDGLEIYQSDSISIYKEYLNVLAEKKLLYPCVCSRKNLETQASGNFNTDIYPGICRGKLKSSVEPHALRVKTDGRVIHFLDRLQGTIAENLATQHGDFVVKRKDQIIAYQFAVVIDDCLQKINHVLRGTDLLSSTAKQIYLQQLLELPTPNYMHVPVITDDRGFKLSKQTLASAVDCKNPTAVLFELLVLLKQNPPEDLKLSTVREILSWACLHWNPATLHKLRTIQQPKC